MSNRLYQRRHKHARHIVRHHLASILADWYGVENGSARVLAALWRAKTPLTIPALARESECPEANIAPCISRLRRAGCVIPRSSKWRPFYTLNESSRSDIEKAIRHSLQALAAEIPSRPDEIEWEATQLREALRGDHAHAQEAAALGLTRMQAQLYGTLRRRRMASFEQIQAALGAHRDQGASIRSVYYAVRNLRRKLPPGWAIKTHVDQGYELVTP